MLITDNIRLGRIIRGTGHNALFSVAICLIAYVLNEAFISKHFVFPPFVTSLIGTALAFFIGFNSNQAYDRWWEARKVWGALVNDSRTWARLVLSYISPSQTIPELETAAIRERLIQRHIAFLYALKANLRKVNDQTYTTFLTREEQEKIAHHSNTHNAILLLQTEDIATLYKAGAIDGYRFLELNQTVTAFCNEMGKSERIRNTVFPTTYIYYSRIFIWYLIFSTTVTLADSLGYWALPFGTLVGYIFLTIHMIGQILLNPFDPIPTGIPLDQITRTIEINLLQMAGSKEIPPPVESIKGEYIM
jgi:putative membrane protein